LLVLVSTPIGNLDDISYRSISSFIEAEIVLCEDTRVAKKLFRLLQERHSLQFSPNNKPKKFIPIHQHNEFSFLEKCEASFFEQNIIYLSDAGSPCISDPGSMLVEYCIKNNIQYDFIGGSNALINAYCMSGFNKSRFLFYGFLLKKGKKREIEIDNILTMNHQIILYEAPHRIKSLVDYIASKQSNRIISIAKELTKKNQKVIKDTAINLSSKLNEINTKGEWVVIIDEEISKTDISPITQDDILSLDISNKTKAKLLSKITNQSTKEIYNELMKTSKTV